MKYFLPGQIAEWKQDKQISLVRGLLLGIVLAVIACFVIFGLYLESEMKRLSKAQTIELEAIMRRLSEQRDELGILNGVIFATYGKHASVVVETFRRKEKK